MKLVPKWRRILPYLVVSFVLSGNSFEKSAIAFVPKPLQTAPSVKIRIRLSDADPRVKIRGYDLKIFQANGASLAASTDRLSEWEFRCRFDSRGPVVQGQSARNNRSIVLRSRVVIESPSGFLNYAGRPYRERITIHAVRTPLGGTCEVVNQVDVERYLDGLVNAEFSSRWNEEAVAAQVIAARTYAYFQMRATRLKGESNFDVDATTKDQVYDGSIREDYLASKSVQRTRGIILSAAGTGNKLPIKAFYHSTCGGTTELPEKVWGGKHPGFKRGVVCGFCGKSPRFSWSLDLHGSELSDLLLKDFRKRRLASGPGLKPRSQLMAMGVSSLDASGRVDTMTVKFRQPDGSVVAKQLTGIRLREILGAGRLRSTAFQVVSLGSGEWTLKGHGNGHGVGLCQYGAKGMGEQGYGAADILKHYYPDTILTKAW